MAKHGLTKRVSIFHNSTTEIILWEQWKEAWREAKSRQEILGLIHTGMDISIRKMFRDNSFGPDPVMRTERWRLYLHIADKSSQYPESIRIKAFEALFGGRARLEVEGIFPSRYHLDPREITTLCWWLRPVHGSMLKINQQTIDHAHKRAQENFWNGLRAVLPALLFDGLRTEKDRCHSLTLDWQRRVVVNMIIGQFGVAVLKDAILKGFDGGLWSDTDWHGNYHRVTELNRRVAMFDERMCEVIDQFLDQKVTYEEAFIKGDKVTLFLTWLDSLPKFIDDETMRREQAKKNNQEQREVVRRAELLAEKDRIERELSKSS